MPFAEILKREIAEHLQSLLTQDVQLRQLRQTFPGLQLAVMTAYFLVGIALHQTVTNMAAQGADIGFSVPAARTLVFMGLVAAVSVSHRFLLLLEALVQPLPQGTDLHALCGENPQAIEYVEKLAQLPRRERAVFDLFALEAIVAPDLGGRVEGADAEQDAEGEKQEESAGAKK